MISAAGIQIITTNLFDQLIEQARQSPRQRTNHNFHADLDQNPHRFLNVMIHGTYITPHRHSDPPKDESFLILQGKVAFFIFSDAGEVLETHVVEADPAAGKPGIDIPAGTWHSLIVLSKHAVCYEVKPGPYSISSDKEFADWAPLETHLYEKLDRGELPADNQQRCEKYMEELMRLLD